MEQKSKKDWMKNVIIVFLIIMLLLTLFSNTITNYTLPQVSVAMVNQGEISDVIRGSGTVSAGDAFTIKATETRTILSVDVEKGAHVDMDSPIFTLKDQDSEELSKARDELADLELKYYKSLLTTDMSTDEAVRVNTGGASSFNAYINKLSELEDEIEAAQQNVLDKQQMVDNLEVGKSVEAINQVGQKYSANLEKNLATYAQEDAKTAFDNAKTHLKEALNNDLANVKTEIANSSSTDAQMSSYLGDVRAVLNAIDAYLYPIGSTPPGGGSALVSPGIYGEIIKVASTIDDFNTIYNKFGTFVDPSKPETGVLKNEYDGALEKYKNATNGRNSLEKLQKRQDELTNAITAIDSVNVSENGDYKAATERLRAATLNIDSVQAAIDKSDKTFDAAATYAKDDLAKAKDTLERLKQEKKDLATEIGNALEADKYSEDIVRKKEDLAKLEQKAMGATIKAPISGTIQTISKTAGDTIKPDEELCVIIPDGKDMTIKISISNDQAKKVNIGDTATLANSWAYPDAVCVVKTIADDPDNPGKNSLVTCVITGTTVKTGQNMNLTLASSTKNYEKIVPNSAIRKDNSGDFVYVLVEKSSPLGNRYIAKKVSVNKMASDDNNTAVTGDLNAYSDSVITSSNKMVEGGKQVRLSESSSN